MKTSINEVLLEVPLYGDVLFQGWDYWDGGVPVIGEFIVGLCLVGSESVIGWEKMRVHCRKGVLLGCVHSWGGDNGREFCSKGESL